MSFKKFFHMLSYLQYPFMLTAIYFVTRPYFNGLDSIKENPDSFFQDVNSMLILMGLGISFSSLQDVTKSHYAFDKKVWSNSKKGRIVVFMIASYILIFLAVGISGYFLTSEGVLREVSVGCIIMSLGMFGWLKAAIEKLEYHKVKNEE